MTLHSWLLLLRTVNANQSKLVKILIGNSVHATLNIGYLNIEHTLNIVKPSPPE